MNDVLKELLRIQKEKDLTDKAFGRSLDTTESYWNLIRNNKRPLSLKMQRRACQVYPELLPIFVSSNFINTKVEVES